MNNEEQTLVSKCELDPNDDGTYSTTAPFRNVVMLTEYEVLFRELYSYFEHWQDLNEYARGIVQR